MPSKYSADFKFEVVRQLKLGEKRLGQICRENDLSTSLVIEWRHRVDKRGAQAFPCSFGDGTGDDLGPSELFSAQARIGELERLAS